MKVSGQLTSRILCPQQPLNRRLCESHSGSESFGKEKKIARPYWESNHDYSVIQSVASLCTDCAIQTLNKNEAYKSYFTVISRQFKPNQCFMHTVGYFCLILTKTEMVRQFRVKFHNIKFHEIPSAVLALLNSYRRKARAILMSAQQGFESTYEDVQ